MPKISPLLAVKLTLSSASLPSWSLTESFSTTILGSGFFGALRVILRLTFSPIIISVSDCSVASFVSTVSTYSPFLKMVTLSEISSTSWSLWVMMMIDLLSSRILRRTSNSFSVSCGVRTAVGSSRMRISAPL